MKTGFTHINDQQGLCGRATDCAESAATNAPFSTSRDAITRRPSRRMCDALRSDRSPCASRSSRSAPASASPRLRTAPRRSAPAATSWNLSAKMTTDKAAAHEGGQNALIFWIGASPKRCRQNSGLRVQAQSVLSVCHGKERAGRRAKQHVLRRIQSGITIRKAARKIRASRP